MPFRFTPRVMVAAVLVVFACLVVVAVVAAPWDSASEQREPALTVDPVDGEADIEVHVTLEGIDPTKDIARARIAVTVLDPVSTRDDWVVATSLEGARYIRPSADGIVVPVTAEIPLGGGGVADYPWDGYSTEAAFASGHQGTPDIADVDVRVVLTLATYGFEIDPSGASGPIPVGAGSFTGFAASISRAPGPFAWAVTMMILYWLVALLVMSVAVLVITGWREFEGSRHLSWMSATLFALVAFRNAAPGAPPIGVYFDWAAYFWAVGLVAASLVAVVTYSLMSRGLDKRPGGDPSPR